MLGFLLVATLESSFLVILSFKLIQAEKAAAREFDLLQGSAGLSRVIQKAQKGFEAADAARKKVGDADAEQAYRRACNETTLEMNKVIENLKKNDLDTRGAERLRNSFLDLTAVLENVLSQAKAQGDIKTSYRAVLNNSGDLYTGFVDEIKSIHKALGSNPDKAGTTALSAQDLLLMFALINLLLSLVLLFLIDKGISSPISKLSGNCDRMVRGEIMPPPARMKNEISILEQSFHEMSRLISDNEKRRRNFIEFFQSVQKASLQKVRSCFEALIKDSEMPEKARHNLEKAKGNLATLLQLLQSMTDALSLSKEAKIEPCFEITDTSILLAEAHAAVEALLMKRKISLEISGESRQLSLDPHLIKRVLVNLLSNAIKYSPEGALVKLNLSLAESGKHLRFSILDKGPGISPADQGKLFKEFSQLKAADGIKRSGTGLGLLICKQIVEAHKGVVGVESQESMGSNFWFELPLKQEDLQNKSSEPEPPAKNNVPNFKAKQGLKSKFLILLLCLLIPQSLIVLKLSSMFGNLNSQAQNFYLAKETLLRIEELLGLYLVWKLDVAKSIDEMQIEKVAATEPILSEQLSYCNWIIKNTPRKSQTTERIEQVGKALKKLKKFGLYLNKNKDNLNMAALPQLVSGARKVADLIEDNLFYVMDLEESGIQKSYDGSAAMRSELMSALAAAAALNFVLLALVSLVGLSIIEKIASLKHKAEDFSAGKNLAPTLKGSDELVYLDQHLCEIAQAIKEADEQRQKLIAVINHDLRTPLSSIVNALQLVLGGSFGELSSMEKSLSGSAEDELNRLLQQINDLLLIEKIDAGLYTLANERFELLPVLTSTARSFEPSASKKKIKLVPAIARECRNVFVSGDRSLVEREIAILMSNALNAAPEGSRIDVALKRDGNEISVSVKDQGKGIDNELLPQIFERFRFVAGKPVTGLGLPLAHRLSTIHGGSIKIASSVNGTEMKVMMPIIS